MNSSFAIFVAFKHFDAHLIQDPVSKIKNRTHRITCIISQMELQTKLDMQVIFDKAGDQ